MSHYVASFTYYNAVGGATLMNLIVLLGLLLIFLFLLAAVAAGVGYYFYAKRRSQKTSEMKVGEEVSAQD